MVHGPELIWLSSTQAVSLAVPQDRNEMADKEIIMAGIISDKRDIFSNLQA